MVRTFVSGWRPSPPDNNDRYYAYVPPPALLAALPDEVNLSVPRLPAPFEPAWNQENIGSCGPHSAAKDIVSAAFRLQKMTSCPMPSRLFIYWVTRYLMGTVNQDSGVDNRTLLKALNKFGWCDEKLWPYNPAKFRQQPPDECFRQAESRKITAYKPVAQNLDTMKACLAGGDSFIFGFTCYKSMFTDEVERTGIIPMPRRGDQPSGGHDVLMVGYSDKRRRFIFANSWDQWGVQGYGEIPFEYATDAYMSGDFWTVQHTALPDAPPVPPVPVPTGRKIYVSLVIDHGTGKVESSSSELRGLDIDAVGVTASTPGLDEIGHNSAVTSKHNREFAEAATLGYPDAVRFHARLRGVGAVPSSNELDEDRINWLVMQGWGSTDGWVLAASKGITIMDLIDWINRYGLGINSLINEALELYRAGKLNLATGWELAERYGPGLGRLVMEILGKFGIGKESIEPSAAGGVA